MHRLQHIVSGTDFGPSAGVALAMALELAHATCGSVTVVHVCELDGEDLDDLRLRQCGDALAELVAGLPRSRARVSGVLRSGRPWEKLDNVAAEVGAGLIVIGRREAARDGRAEIGSVAEHLIRCASRPVLLVPPDFTRLDAEAFRRKEPCTERKAP